MITKLIKIGNSKGIRIPKSLLNETGLTDKVEIMIKDDSLIIKPKKKVRENWDKAFSKMAQNNDDVLLDEESAINLNEWDNEEWEW